MEIKSRLEKIFIKIEKHVSSPINNNSLRIDFFNTHIRISKKYKRILLKEGSCLSGNINKEELISMLDSIIENGEKNIDEVSREIGFIQGVLVSNELIDFKKELSYTKPLFNKIYKKHKGVI